MQQSDFPIVSRDNLVLSCFNCYSDLINPYFFETENAHGRGRYFASCECCDIRTFFDFEGVENGNLPQNA